MVNLKLEDSPYSIDYNFQKIMISKDGNLIKVYEPGDYAIFERDETDNRTWVSTISIISARYGYVKLYNPNSEGLHCSSDVSTEKFIKWNAEFNGFINQPGFIDCSVFGYCCY